MKRCSLFFDAPFQTRIRERSVPDPGEGEVRVAARMSAVSAGTEMLVYRGDFPDELAVDETIQGLVGRRFEYPLAYGYCSVGAVEAVGAGVNPAWIGRRVFTFHPHDSHFLARPDALVPIPSSISDADAVFLAGMETAVNLVMDGRPIIGERVAVAGLGVIGLMTTALLARFPLEELIGIDRIPMRREAALAVGAHHVLSGEASGAGRAMGVTAADPEGDQEADLIYELTGSPKALNLAIELAGFGSRIVIGSWYGKKKGTIDLGGRFHRNRIQVLSSQVSTIDPRLTGRWTAGRRLDAAWQMIEAIAPSRFITHRYPIREADRAYRQIADRPEEILQVVLTYAE